MYYCISGSELNLKSRTIFRCTITFQPWKPFVIGFTDISRVAVGMGIPMGIPIPMGMGIRFSPVGIPMGITIGIPMGYSNMVSLGHP